ncbi:DUF1232 domain-containing protein [Myxococcota bacterium]|nr:DUF1232 domain-containing protein [Myxococcota bacterium]MBU1380516.1 DUF1232 domain-containing protein [Myxococcota bacterium]MBU1497287.1 DUF1232 domain-containing protein [Myxococcota bacterium]
MSQDQDYTPYFQEWIDNYADDIRALLTLVADKSAAEELRRLCIGTLNYGLKQLDLIPDFYTPVGLIDDTMVIRIFANLGIDYIIKLENEVLRSKLVKLSEGDDIIHKFVGDEIYRALVNYVKSQPDRKVRQRDARIILGNDEILKEFVEDVKVEISGYEGAKITDPVTVQKDLKSFLKLKLVG